MKRFLFLIFLLIAGPAFAGSGTYSPIPGATFSESTDANGFFYPNVFPQVSGDIIVTPSNSFTRPANTTTYTANTIVANSTTAGSVVPLVWTVTRVNAGNSYVRRAIMVSTGKSITVPANFVLYLFTGTAAPTTTSGDNAAFSGAVTLVNEFCAIPITLTEKGSDDSIGRGMPDVGNECNFVAGAGVSTIWGLVVTTGAYIPISAEVEKFILEVHEN